MNPAHEQHERFVGSVEQYWDYLSHDVEAEDMDHNCAGLVIVAPDGTERPAPTTHAAWELLDAMEPEEEEEMSSVMMSEAYYESVTIRK